MLWVDNAKILASFAVIIVHVSSLIVLGVDDHNNSFWWAGNIYNSFSRWCVPVFVMLSGLLLLDPYKKESLKVFYKKRLFKICIPVLFWTLFYLVWVWIASMVKQDSVTIETLINKALTGQAYYHMWYLYMLVGLYLVTPFFRKLVGAISVKELIVLCAIMFFMSISQNIANYFTDCENSLIINWFLLYLPYLVAGHIIQSVELYRYNHLFVVVFLASVIITSLGCYFLFNTFVGLYFYSYLSVSVIVMSISLIILLKNFTVKTPISHFSALLLGIYLIHPVFIDLLKFFGITPLRFHPFIAIPIISLIVFVLSAFTSKLILKVPYLRRAV